MKPPQGDWRSSDGALYSLQDSGMCLVSDQILNLVETIVDETRLVFKRKTDYSNAECVFALKEGQIYRISLRSQLWDL